MENSKYRLEKFEVCDQCYSVGLLYNDCICSYGKYEIIELEFEVCQCCGNLVDDGTPADTPFNRGKLKK